MARRWALIVIVCAYAVEWLGSQTGFPFGNYHYTENFGPTLEGVPLTIPLAWHVVVTNALFVVRAIAPHLSQFIEAIVVGISLHRLRLHPRALRHHGEALLVLAQGDSVSVPPLNYA